MKKTLFGFLMVGLAFIALQVETAEAQIGIDHPCYDIDPSNGGRDGHPCWQKGGHLSEDAAKLTARNAELEYELSAARDALNTLKADHARADAVRTKYYELNDRWISKEIVREHKESNQLVSIGDHLVCLKKLQNYELVWAEMEQVIGR